MGIKLRFQNFRSSVLTFESQPAASGSWRKTRPGRRIQTPEIRESVRLFYCFAPRNRDEVLLFIKTKIQHSALADQDASPPASTPQLSDDGRHICMHVRRS